MKSSEKLFSNRTLFSLIWPLLIEQLLGVLVGMVDVLMVASLGEVAVSGVSLIDALNALIIQFLAALTAGGTVVCAQFIGMKDRKRAAQSAGQTFFVSVAGCLALVVIFLISGNALLHAMFGQAEAAVIRNAHIYFVITIFSYPFLALYNSGAALFRAAGNSKISMKTALFMNALNVAGNALCIYVLKMGVEGVAIPTLIARAVAAIIMICLLQRPQNEIRVHHLSDLIPRKDLIRRILGIGIPGGVESAAFQFGKVVLQSLVSTLGTPAMAAFAVAGNLVTFLYLPGNAVGLAVTTVIGQCVGAGEAEQAKYYSKKLILVNYAMLAVICSVLGFARHFWIGLYQLTGLSAAWASGLVWTHCVAMVIWPIAFTLPIALRSANDATFSMIIALIAMWGCRVALAYLFVQGFGLNILFVWVAMYLDWVVRFIAYLLRFKGFVPRIKRLQKTLIHS